MLCWFFFHYCSPAIIFNWQKKKRKGELYDGFCTNMSLKLSFFFSPATFGTIKCVENIHEFVMLVVNTIQTQWYVFVNVCVRVGVYFFSSLICQMTVDGLLMYCLGQTQFYLLSTFNHTLDKIKELELIIFHRFSICFLASNFGCDTWYLLFT